MLREYYTTKPQAHFKVDILILRIIILTKIMNQGIPSNSPARSDIHIDFYLQRARSYVAYYEAYLFIDEVFRRCPLTIIVWDDVIIANA